MMVTLDTPEPNDAPLNWSSEFESRLWSMTLLWLACFWEVAWMGRGLDPPPPMMMSAKRRKLGEDEGHQEHYQQVCFEVCEHFRPLGFCLHLKATEKHKAMAVSCDAL